MTPIESGTLPAGVSYDGKRCREFTLEPLKVKHSLAVNRSEDKARCAADDELMGLALIGRRLSIEGVPAERMTLSMMEELLDEDLAEIMEAEGRLQEQMARFRGEGAQAADPGPGQAGDALGDGRTDAGGAGPAVAGGLGRAQESGRWVCEDLDGAPAP